MPRLKDTYKTEIVPALMQKFGYIAQYHGRSKNKEIEVMMRSVIDSFEYKNGPIQPADIAASSQNAKNPG